MEYVDFLNKTPIFYNRLILHDIILGCIFTMKIRDKGIFAGTFENSKDDRTWTAGIQRDVYRTNLGVLSVDIGYRLGLMYGYETMEIADSGIFPLLQVYSDLRYKMVGVQFSWAGSVVTAGCILHF